MFVLISLVKKNGICLRDLNTGKVAYLGTPNNLSFKPHWLQNFIVMIISGIIIYGTGLYIGIYIYIFLGDQFYDSPGINWLPKQIDIVPITRRILVSLIIIWQLSHHSR